MEDLDNMTGLNSSGPRALILDQLSLNGDAEIQEIAPGKFAPKGGYYRLLKLKDAKKDVKPEEEKLGASVSVVFLKIRRVLQERNGDKLIRWVSEHNTPDDIVELKTSDLNGVEVGSARALREKYTGLRTIQYVYGLLLRDGKEPELVKMRFKGSALGSEVKAEGVKTFYDYISEVRKGEDGKVEHLRHYETLLAHVKEEGKKTYFTVTFERGEKLSPELCALADQTLREVFENITATDTARINRIKALGAKGDHIDEIPDDEGGIQYPTEEVNPDDIPFGDS